MMRKTIVLVLIAIAAAAALFLYMAYGENEPYDHIPQSNIRRINEGELNWYNSLVANYDISVQVSFSSERRLNELEIRDNIVTSARAARWDEAAETWGSFSELDAEAYRFYTIPGLYETLRTSLQNDDVIRKSQRFSVDDTYWVPDLIYLGDIIQDESGVEGTALLLEVLSFELVEP